MTTTSFRTACYAALALGCCVASTKFARSAEPNADTPTHENVSYGPHERNVLDLWLAKSDKATPLVIFMHGGGFRQGDKEGVRGRPVIAQCLAAGVSFASINYRFLNHAGLPSILRDAARSIQFIRSRAADWNIDPARIAIYGSSAGAGTSMWLAFHDDLADPQSADPVLRQSSRVAAAGSLDGQVSYDLRDWKKYVGPSPFERPAAEWLTFYGFASDDEAKSPAADAIMKDCSMIDLVSRDDPPVGLACHQPDGESEDRGHYVHHPRHAMALADRCKQQGVKCLLVLRDNEDDRANQAKSVVGYLIEKLKTAK